MSTSSVMTPEQQEQFRREKIFWLGGSEIASTYSLPPYGCALRLTKIKRDEPMDEVFRGNNATRRGQRWEAFAGHVYTEVTGRTIRRVAPKQDEVVPRLRPQPDYEIVNDARGPEWGRGILSVKNPGAEMFAKLKRAITVLTGPEPRNEWERKQLEEGKAALRPYLLQVFAEMAAQKVKWGSFAIYWPDGDEIVYVDVDRDDDIIAEIRAKAAEFVQIAWDRTLPDPPKLDPESRQCKTCEYRVSCQKEHLLKLLEKEADGGEVKMLVEIDAVVADLREAERLQEQAEALVVVHKGHLKAIIEAAGVDAAQGNLARVYYRLQQGRESFQQKDFFAAHPELKEGAKAYFKRGAPFRAMRVYDLVKKFDKAADAAGATVATTQVQ